MKCGVFFWGFQNLDLISELSRKLKENHFIDEFYVQISPQEKTVHLLEMFPEEVLRAHSDDVHLLQLWINKNSQKNIIIVLNFWSFILCPNFFEKIKIIQEMINQNNKMIIVCPKFYAQQKYIFSENGIPHDFLEGSQYFSQKVKILHELVLNSGNSTCLLCTPICDPLISNEQLTLIYQFKSILFFHFLPKMMRNYPSAYLTRKGFVSSLCDKMAELIKQSENPLSKEKNDSFRTLVKADAIYQFDAEVKGKRWNRGIFISAPWRAKGHENDLLTEGSYLEWFRILGVLEYYSQQNPSRRMELIFHLFFSNQ